jgi:hypothetical protein
MTGAVPAPPPSRPARGASVWALRAVLVLLVWTAYYPVWENDFVDFDDEPFITHNDHVCAGLTGWRWALFNTEPPYRMPLTWLSLQLDVELSGWVAPGSAGPRPEIVHAHNLLWHCACVLLLFGLCLRLPGGTRGRAFLVAALFAVHPMHVESVAWGIERKDVLMCAFGLLCARAYLRFAETRRPVFFAGALAALALSLAAKPMLLTMPLVLLLLDHWPLGRTRLAPGPAGGASLARLVREKGPFFVLALAAAAATVQTRAGTTLGNITLGDRLMNALAGYGWYVTTTLWPAQLAAVYPHPRDNWSWGASLTGAAILVIVTLVAVRQARARPWLFVGWFWFVGTLFPVIGLAQGGPQAWADRFSYWPHIGLFVALVWGAADLGARLAVPAPVARVLWAGALGALLVLTSEQVRHWRDSVALWEHTVAVTRDNLYAHERLSLAYRRQGRTEEADVQARAAVRLVVARMRAARPRP